MANNQNVNKVVYDGVTLMDVTDTTATESDVVTGKVFTKADGSKGTGTANYMDLVSNPTANDILVTDANGQAIDSGESIGDLKMLAIPLGSISSLPQTVSNSNITSDMIVAKSYLSKNGAQIGDWSVSTSDGSLTLSGSIIGTTTVTLFLMKRR